MIDLKRLRHRIKQDSNKNSIAQILSFIGYEINKDFMFKIREDERTASTSIRQDGYIKDFGGSSWGGDIVAFIYEYKGMDLPSSTKYVAQCLGIDLNDFEIKNISKKRGRRLNATKS